MIADASVVVKWFTVEALSEDARELLSATESLLAPDLLAIELANVMWGKVRSSEIGESAAARAIAAVIAGDEIQLRSSIPLVPRAFGLARALDHPVYDCVYLALAEELDQTLVTADQRFVIAAARDHPRVRMLGSDRV